jgi:hypothetical protein
MEKLLNSEDFSWEREEYMTGNLDSQRLTRVQANMPRFYPRVEETPCRACQAGYHCDPAFSCGCPCHQPMAKAA